MFAIADNPLFLVEHSLLAISSRQIFFSLFSGHTVNGHKMLEKSCSLLTAMNKQNMLDVVAVPAKGLESQQSLAVVFLIILPDLVAVQSASLAAYPAAVSCPSIDRSADPVPLSPGQQFGQAGQTGAGRYRFDG